LHLAQNGYRPLLDVLTNSHFAPTEVTDRRRSGNFSLPTLDFCSGFDSFIICTRINFFMTLNLRNYLPNVKKPVHKRVAYPAGIDIPRRRA